MDPGTGVTMSLYARATDTEERERVDAAEGTVGPGAEP